MPTWGRIAKTRRSGHLHLGRCFSVGTSQKVSLDEDGNKLYSFVLLGGHERHIFWKRRNGSETLPMHQAMVFSDSLFMPDVHACWALSIFSGSSTSG